MFLKKLTLPLLETDVQRLCELDQDIGHGSFRQEDWRNLAPNNNVFVIGELEGKNAGPIVGFLLAAPLFAQCNAHLLKITIESSKRSKGLARKALSEWIKYLKEAEACGIYLEVDEHNHPAIRLYRSLGFNTLCIKKGFYSDGKNALAMELNFNN